MPIRDGNIAWITEAINSIAAQVYPGVIELVVINHDCRMSLSSKIKGLIGTLAQECDPEKFRFIIHVIDDDTLEFSQILDLGVALCAGEIIVRMDCDDIAKPNLVDKVSGFLVQNMDVDVCGVQLHFFGSKEMATHHPAIITRESALSCAGTWFVNHPGVAIRKAALTKVGGYGNTKTGFAEDYHLWVKMLNAGSVIINLPDILVDYRCYHKKWRYPDGYQDFLNKEKETLRHSNTGE
jgi:cellulose synthase/poly-beta-1,6-N-acetylglucosamine synthase-like glycosyltransferase